MWIQRWPNRTKSGSCLDIVFWVLKNCFRIILMWMFEQIKFIHCSLSRALITLFFFKYPWWHLFIPQLFIGHCVPGIMLNIGDKRLSKTFSSLGSSWYSPLISCGSYWRASYTPNPLIQDSVSVFTWLYPRLFNIGVKKIMLNSS